MPGSRSGGSLSYVDIPGPPVFGSSTPARGMDVAAASYLAFYFSEVRMSSVECCEEVAFVAQVSSLSWKEGSKIRRDATVENWMACKGWRVFCLAD